MNNLVLFMFQTRMTFFCACRIVLKKGPYSSVAILYVVFQLQQLLNVICVSTYLNVLIGQEWHEKLYLKLLPSEPVWQNSQALNMHVHLKCCWTVFNRVVFNPHGPIQYTRTGSSVTKTNSHLAIKLILI